MTRLLAARRRALTSRASGAALLLSLACTGCALQLAPALHLPTRGRRVPSVELGFRYKPARNSGMYGALDATFADPTTQATFTLRELAIGAGYHFALGPFGLALGPRLGAGQPAFAAFDGTGLHTGLELASLFRVVGHHEREVGFIPFEIKVDLLVFARGGVWARPADSGQEVWDASFGLGLRVGLASDLTDYGDRWEARR